MALFLLFFALLVVVNDVIAVVVAGVVESVWLKRWRELLLFTLIFS